VDGNKKKVKPIRKEKKRNEKRNEILRKQKEKNN